MVRFQINDSILIKSKEYKVVCIDSFSIGNVLGKRKSWVSYTLKYGRDIKWITVGINKKTILWELRASSGITSEAR